MAGGSKVIVFDFDQTISCNHVFKLLAGWTSDPSCPPEVGATTEFGQLRRITELESADPDVVKSWFGGQKRINELSKFLESLKSNQCELYVCSKGLLGPVRASLERVNLLQHFADVHGIIDTYGLSPYDQTLEKQGWTPSVAGDAYKHWIDHCERHENTEWASGRRGKAWLCLHLAKKDGVQRPSMLVEDDPEEIDKANRKSVATCFVEDRAGVGKAEMKEISSWARGDGGTGGAGAGQ